ncbi:MAG: serine hydrolase domain-containing protein [Ignavibacteriaceae bacterium]
MSLTKILLVTALVFGLSAAANSQTEDSFENEKLESYLNAIYQKKGFSGEILVANGMNILFQETIGLSSYENNLELNIGAKYRIASITKTFTGTLIAIAREEGKLNSRDKAIDYLNGLSPKFKEITIEQLLTHTSGLPHNESIKDYWQIKSKLHMTPAQVIAEINALELLFEPGSQFRYSSLGYYLLASILENVYNNSFENILKDKILNKLQMTETGIVDNLKIIPQLASGYHLVTDDSLVVAPYRNFSMLKGSGDMYSTATDLLKWNHSFFSNILLSNKTKATVFSQRRKTLVNSGDNYGYGWFISSDTPQKYYHGGGTWGFSTYSAMYPDQQISIIILSNVSTLPISSIAGDVEKIVFGIPFEIPTVEEVSKDSIHLEMYSGTFVSDSNNMVLNISRINNNLYSRLGNNPPFEIYPKGNHRFFGKKIDIEFTFEITNDSITEVSAERMGQIFHFKKVTK